MAYAQPNSTVWLIKGYHGDRNYAHTVRFATIQDQQNYFYNKVQNGGRQLSNLLYVRHTENSIKVKGNVEDFLYYNYMAFKNNTKWFYAFIDRVEYVNIDCTIIYYTMDVIQTWWFDFTMGECFVEREHVRDDTFGTNIIPENINGSVNVVMKEQDITWFTEAGLYYADIWYVPQYNETPNTYNICVYESGADGSSGRIAVSQSNTCGSYEYGNVYGIEHLQIPPYSVIVDGRQEYQPQNMGSFVNKCLREMTSYGANIIAINPIPFYLIDNPKMTLTNNTEPSEGDPGDGRNIVLFNRADSFKDPNSGETYYPKNKKLYTSQYCKLMVTNNSGESTDMNLTDFKFDEIYFGYDAHISPSPDVTLYPLNYKGVSGTTPGVRSAKVDYNTRIVYRNFGAYLYSEDSFTKWYTEHAESFYTTMVASMIAGIGKTAIAAGAMIGTGGTAAPLLGTGVIDLANNIAGSYATYRNAANALDTSNGKIANSQSNFMRDKVGFTIYQIGVNCHEAKTIDDYFTVYGYQVNTVKVPAPKSGLGLRPSYNYVKAKNITIHNNGDKSVPFDIEETITNIFENGITFWEKDVEIGDYTVSNRAEFN